MNMKAYMLIAVGVVWIAAALHFFLYRDFSVAVIGSSGRIPLWLTIGIFLAVQVLILFVWLVPLAAGIRLLMKRP
jgi:hypothetical protein